jgi:hypothetical protein
LIEGNLIAGVSHEPLTVMNAFVIDAGGRTLMPSLIEAHGEPPQDIRPLMDSDKIDLMLKDGAIYKNEL